MRKIMYIIFVVLWMVLIFVLSNQPADNSTKLSDGFIENTIGNVYQTFNNDVTDEKLMEIKSKYSHPVRKMAHFTIYFILGVLVSLLVSEYSLKKMFLIAFLVCFLYACSDEIHQLFVVGRSGEIRDVLIDTSGSFLGIFSFFKFFHKNN